MNLVFRVRSDNKTVVNSNTTVRVSAHVSQEHVLWRSNVFLRQRNCRTTFYTYSTRRERPICNHIPLVFTLSFLVSLFSRRYLILSSLLLFSVSRSPLFSPFHHLIFFLYLHDFHAFALLTHEDFDHSNPLLSNFSFSISSPRLSNNVSSACMPRPPLQPVISTTQPTNKIRRCGSARLAWKERPDFSTWQHACDKTQVR